MIALILFTVIVVVLILCLNMKDEKGSPEIEPIDPRIRELLERGRLNMEKPFTLDEQNLLNIHYRRMERNKATRERRQNEKTDAQRKANIAAGIMGSTIAIGSILLDARDTNQRMLDVDRRN